MRHLTAHEVRDLGVLLEVNRQLLHPRGLALEVTYDPDDPELVGKLRVQDHRDDPEGVYFAELNHDDVAKAARFAGSVRTHRRSALGYIVQPLNEALKERT
jgi:hypothetical protein